MSDPQISGVIRPVPLADALAERYMSYAMSTITARSLPDVRDGLKPVHRRLLHAMRELRLNPDSGFKKCARIVGDVMRALPKRKGQIYVSVAAIVPVTDLAVWARLRKSHWTAPASQNIHCPSCVRNSAESR